ncbi:hypothetical protein DVH24_008037 [Malus domestica]|uniref:PB1-like domain-containing protein n=1 Tax=Malus domestica TaxID=3750 RepID=A0A498JL21_MALDO|nr:hypothetical protein DVH24_008037 [Malus domestica]
MLSLVAVISRLHPLLFDEKKEGGKERRCGRGPGFLRNEIYPYLVSIRLHHGGKLGHERYYGGKVTYINYCDKDLMALLIRDGQRLWQAGYSEMFMNYYYKITNMNICNGLKPIQSDVNV